MDSPVICVLDRIDAPDVRAVEPAFRVAGQKVVIDLRRASVATPQGVAALARLVRRAQHNDVRVEIVSAHRHTRRALVAAGLHHLVSLSE